MLHHQHLEISELLIVMNVFDQYVITEWRDVMRLFIAVHLFCASYTMATASPDNIKQWKFPDGNFIQNLSGHTAIINTLALNQDNVLVSGGE